MFAMFRTQCLKPDLICWGETCTILISLFCTHPSSACSFLSYSNKAKQNTAARPEKRHLRRPWRLGLANHWGSWTFEKNWETRDSNRGWEKRRYCSCNASFPTGTWLFRKKIWSSYQGHQYRALGSRQFPSCPRNQRISPSFRASKVLPYTNCLPALKLTWKEHIQISSGEYITCSWFFCRANTRASAVSQSHEEHMDCSADQTERWIRPVKVR